MLDKMFNKNFWYRLRHIALAFILIVGIFALDLAHSPQALAGDNYSAETGTYQETRNLNRVDTTREELTSSKLNTPKEETKGESIYETVVDRVNQQRDTSIKGSNTETKSEP